MNLLYVSLTKQHEIARIAIRILFVAFERNRTQVLVTIETRKMVVVISFPEGSDAFANDWFGARMANELELPVVMLLTVNLATVFIDLVSDCEWLRAFLVN